MLKIAFRYHKSIRMWLFIALVSLSANSALCQEPLPQAFGPWERVSYFTISQSEDYVVLSILILGKDQLYESSLVDGKWTELKPIDTINKHHGEGFDIEGPSLNFNSQTLYFHANFPDSKGGFDIYYSERNGNEWGAPVNLGRSINTAADEVYPSVIAGSDKIFFARSNPNIEFKKPKDTPACQILYMSNKDQKGNWEAPTALHNIINKGCEYSPRVAIDGKTLVLASIDAANYKLGYDIYYTREILQDNWLESSLLVSSEGTNIAPQIAGEHLYYINKSIQKKEEISKIFRVKIPDQAKPLKTVSANGKIITLADQKPIDAELTVFNPTTLQKLGTFTSNKQTGEFEIPLLDQQNYIVDVRRQGYSFSSFMVDLRGEEKETGPDLIQLFESIELEVTAFDNENFRPILAEVLVENALDSNIVFKSKMISEGIYSLSLPIGYEYIVKANTIGFEANSFNFNLTGDIVFARFERSLALSPIRKLFEIIISDSETQEDVAAEVLITNLNREEVMVFSAQDIKDGKVAAMLREGDQYEFTVRGAQGYSFFNQVVDLQEEKSSELKAELVSLKAETSIRLNNINFSTNSADLSSESFPELNRVIQLLEDNPAIVIEIAAHSDNVGSATFNKLLSERRAQSVVNYLLENGVNQEKLVAKGYGLTQPMVPNTSEENRALNRRVEFKIVDITDEEESEL